MITRFPDTIFRLRQEDFTRYALRVFEFQYRHNQLYKAYTDGLGVYPGDVKSIGQIPFLPVDFFKTHSIQTTSFEPEMIFESSGTTQAIKSRHFLKSLSIYQKSFTQGFEIFYGPLKDWCILGLLPSYSGRTQSSLACMVRDWINMSGHLESGFYLSDYLKLYQVLKQLEKKGRRTLLIGVTFALLDFADNFQMKLEHTVIMETGGMKGRRKELTRQEVHGFLKERLGVREIHSEYGMTELLSQAYSKGEGLFKPVPWMKVLVRAEDDPIEVREQGTGILNIIDLANIFSCSFIASEDIGWVRADRSFEVWGRMDYSDIRGCNLLIGENP